MGNRTIQRIVSRFAQRFVPRLAQRFVVATALLSVVVASAATGGTWLRCRLTGVLLPDCCCPADGVADDSEATPASVKADDCCDRIVTSVDQAPSEMASRDALAAPARAISIALPIAAAPADLAARGRVEWSRAGPATTRAVLLSKSSLLI